MNLFTRVGLFLKLVRKVFFIKLMWNIELKSCWYLSLSHTVFHTYPFISVHKFCYFIFLSSICLLLKFPNYYLKASIVFSYLLNFKCTLVFITNTSIWWFFFFYLSQTFHILLRSSGLKVHNLKHIFPFEETWQIDE